MSPSVAREFFHQAASGYLEYESATGKFTYRRNRQRCSPSLTVPCICREGSISRQSCWKGKTFTFISILVSKDQDIVVIIPVEIDQFNDVPYPFWGRSCRMSPAGYMRLMGFPHHDKMI